MGEGLAGISEDTEASTQNQTTEATLMENRNDGKASSGEDNANVASGVNALGRISNLLIGKSSRVPTASCRVGPPASPQP